MKYTKEDEVFEKDEIANKRKDAIITSLADDYMDYLSELTCEEIDAIAENGVFLKKDVN